MTDDEKKKMSDLEAKVTDLTGQVTTLTTEKEAETAKVTELTKTVTEKEAVIAQKTADIVGARRKFSELTAAEKADMTAKEQELQKGHDELDEKMTAFEKTQAESLKKEVDARKERFIAKFAGNDKDLRKKIEDNLSRINDSATMQTEEEVSKVVGDAFNMTGTPRPSSLHAVIGDGQGGASTEGGEQKFAESQQGKDFASKLGIVIPEAPKA